MTKLEKMLGAVETCSSCQNKIVCREVEYKGEKKLQWQNDDGTSHYSFDPQTKKSSCKKLEEKTNQIKQELESTQELHLAKIPLNVEAIATLQSMVAEKMDVMAVTYLTVRQKLMEYGLSNPNPALAGMFFNRVREELRIHE